jgi:hypothetical protein
MDTSRGRRGTTSQEWIDFFVETLINHIEPDGSFGYPIFTFATDTADMTVVPTKDDEG